MNRLTVIPSFSLVCSAISFKSVNASLYLVDDALNMELELNFGLKLPGLISSRNSYAKKILCSRSFVYPSCFRAPSDRSTPSSTKAHPDIQRRILEERATRSNSNGSSVDRNPAPRAGQFSLSPSVRNDEPMERQCNVISRLA